MNTVSCFQTRASERRTTGVRESAGTVRNPGSVRKEGGRCGFRRVSAATSRAGFTLLEVLLALGLGALLLTAVYGALDLYWKFSTAGRLDAERCQLARALLQKMEQDIDCVIYRAARDVSGADQSADEMSDGGSNASSVPPDSTGGSTGLDPMGMAGASSSRTLGVYGDSGTLILDVSRPVRDWDFSPLAESELSWFQTSDLKSVRYFLAGAGMGGLQDLSAAGSNPQGLARLEGELLMMDQAEIQGNVQGLTGGVQLLAPEVTTLQFRYFDGEVWLDAWDSQQLKALPQAIEILIGFQDLGDEIGSLAGYPASTSTERFRLVVDLPLARQMVPEPSL